MQDIKKLSPYLSIAGQITTEDIQHLAKQGYKSIINNRPDKESDDQPDNADLAAEARKQGIAYREVPVIAGQLGDADVQTFMHAQQTLEGPLLAFCRTGTRSITLWALSQVGRLDIDAIVSTAKELGYNLNDLRPRLVDASKKALPISKAQPAAGKATTYEVVIIGGGSAGIATAASLLQRRPSLDIAVIEPRDRHYYQPGYTLAGAGVFRTPQLSRDMKDVMPERVRWIKTAAAAFDPDNNEVILEDSSRVQYQQLIVAPGLKLDWDQIDGLSETLGINGVTSNYRHDLTSYTWELVQNLKSGRALFTQPPMPIKCAGAPQKAMYLSCDHWLTRDCLKQIDVEFYNAGGVLFGVDTYVPALMEYIEKYNAQLNFSANLVAVDGPKRIAWFESPDEDGKPARVGKPFDMLHVCPPQTAPDFIRNSPLADAAGWVDVHPETLQHVRYDNIFGLGDATSTPNAKTMAAARKQAPIVAENVVDCLEHRAPLSHYDGYGSCPLTVERGKVVLAEFGYGGKLLPSFPKWLIDGKHPSKLAWFLKERLLPPVYYKLMLRGREWLAKPLRAIPDGQKRSAGQ